MPVEPAGEPPAEAAPSGDGIAIERDWARKRAAADAEMAEGAVDLQPARDHAEEDDGVEPVGQAHDAVVALDGQPRLLLQIPLALPTAGK